jgi:hypothetical protein
VTDRLEARGKVAFFVPCRNGDGEVKEHGPFPWVA